jgi:hypothetical protein
MPRNKELWRTGIKHRADTGIIVARITAYMLDQHIHILTLEAVYVAIHQSQVTPITVTAYSAERSEGCQFLSHFHITDIASMPYLITRFEVMKILLIPIAVGIA